MKNMALNEEELQKFMQQPDENSVVMINLLKFKKNTENGEPGIASYFRYMQNAAPFLAKVGGKLLWHGVTDQYIIAGQDDRWDRVLLVEYPSRAAFLQMINMPEFQAIQHDRIAALEDTVLIASTTQ